MYKIYCKSTNLDINLVPGDVFQIEQNNDIVSRERFDNTLFIVKEKIDKINYHIEKLTNRNKFSENNYLLTYWTFPNNEQKWVYWTWSLRNLDWNRKYMIKDSI